MQQDDSLAGLLDHGGMGEVVCSLRDDTLGKTVCESPEARPGPAVMDHGLAARQKFGLGDEPLDDGVGREWGQGLATDPARTSGAALAM